MSQSRFQELYASTAQLGGVVNDRSWDAIFQDIDLRLLASEEQAPRIAELIETTQQLALDRLNETLAPAIGRIQTAAEFGFLMATSLTEAILAKDAVVRFHLAEGPQRELFQPSAFVNVTRLSTPDDYAVGRVRGFARAQGELDVEIIERWGAPGPFDDWQISSSAGVVASVVRMLDAVRSLEGLFRTLRREVGQDREATGADRRAVADHVAFITTMLEDVNLALATPTGAGLMSAGDKEKLDGLEAGSSIAASIADAKRNAYALNLHYGS